MDRIKFLSVKQNLVKNIKYKLPGSSVLTTADIKGAISIEEILPLVLQSEGYRAECGDDNNLGYDAIIKDIIEEENLYLRQLHIIAKVFRDFILMKSKALKIEFVDRLDLIFCNINFIIGLTMQVIISMEDLLELKDRSDGRPFASDFFYDVAETKLFDDYVKFTEDVLSEKFKSTFEELITRPDVSNDVKYYLPMLLQEPIYHFFHYHRYVKNLRIVTSSEDEKRSLDQVLGMLNDPLYKVITTVMQMPGYFGSIKRTPVDIFHHTLAQKKRPKSEDVDDDKEDTTGSITNLPPEFPLKRLAYHIFEGPLMILDGVLKERYVFLFQDLIVVTRAHKSLNGEVTAHYTYKESYFFEKIEIKDKEDSDTKIYSEKTIIQADTVSISSSKEVGDFLVGRVPEPPCESLNYTFQIEHFEKDKKEEIIFKADSVDEKNAWMAALFMLKSKPTLEAALDAILLKEKNNNPLKLPSPSRYVFSEPDSPQNIRVECKTEVRSTERIKCATLVKLVERITQPSYSTPKLVKDFLMTFRSFSTPNEVLDLLIQRFNIPNPEWYEGESQLEVTGLDETAQLQLVIDQKRFRSEYVRPVQTYVLNVLKHWVSLYFYDFEIDKTLYYKLDVFIKDIENTPIKGKWTDIIRKNMRMKHHGRRGSKNVIFTFSAPEPEIEIHLELKSEPGWPEILTYHPTEIARQLTLLDFEYFRSVKPHELVDCSWMDNKNKHVKSPTVMKVTKHFNNVTHYFQKILVETENLEERQAIMNRLLEIMNTFQKINNFNGMFSITAAFHSASIYRLYKTKDGIRKELNQELQKVIALKEEHDAKYMEQLHKINPPVVPYLGTYQDRIFKFGLGNPDFFPCCSSNDFAEDPSHQCEERKLINFYKRTKVAEQISEIQQYQQEPYSFKIYPALRNFLESLDPFPNTSCKDMEDHLFNKSKEIEPHKDADPKQAERKWPTLQLISPNLAVSRKPSARRSTKMDKTTNSASPQFCFDAYGQTSNTAPSSPNREAHAFRSHSLLSGLIEPFQFRTETRADNPLYPCINALDQPVDSCPIINLLPLPPKPKPPIPPKGKSELPPIPPRRPQK
jgi:son of sevenless-like protein